jgi:putative hydrolase of the HAD superfamily
MGVDDRRQDEPARRAGVRTIVFDFGNVIAFFDHQRAIRRLAPFTDLPPIELTLQLYGGTIEEDYEYGRLSTAEYVRAARLNGRLTCSDEEFLAAFVDIFWRNDPVCELIPRLAERYRLVLASNTNDAHFRKYSDQFADVLGHFDHLGTSHTLGARKPHPEFFARVQRFVAAEPGGCVFVDDLPINVEAACRHGWAGVVYRPGDDLAAELGRLGIQVGGASR